MAQVYRQKYTSKMANGQRVSRTASKWYIDYTDYVDGEPVRRRVAGYTDKVATQQLAAELERKAERRKAGIIDKGDELQLRPLSEHLAAWSDALYDKGTTAKQADLIVSRVKAAFAGIGAKLWGELDANKVLAYLADRRSPRVERLPDGTEREKPGISIQTCNHFLRHLKQFARWMVRTGRAKRNPFDCLAMMNAKTDRRHERRVLSADEIAWLLSTTHGAAEWRGIVGSERELIYRVVLQTGLRATELRSLTVGSFRLTATSPTVTVSAAYSKRRREDVLPLRPDLAELLKTHFKGKLGGAKALSIPKSYDTADMIRADLDKTRAAWISKAESEQDRQAREASDFLKYTDSAGRVADFHALRHTFITNLARAGVHPKVAQQLARHSSITLTMDRYSHTVIGELAEALDMLPGLAAVHADSTQQRATGTDCVPVNEPLDAADRRNEILESPRMSAEKGRRFLSRTLSQETCGESRRLTECVGEKSPADEGRAVTKPNKIKSLDGDGRPMSSSVVIAADRTRTDDLRFTKPLLYQLSYGGEAVSIALAGRGHGCDGGAMRALGLEPRTRGLKGRCSTD